MTDPPFIGAMARIVAARFRVPLLVIAQDVFPEIAVKLGRLHNPVVVRSLRLLVDSSLRSADRVVAIGDTMKRRLEEKGVQPDRIRVIPNWVDVRRVRPAPRDNPWAREHRLTRRFVVMHSGNVGYAQDLDTLIRACTFLRDLNDLAVRIIGGGARREELVRLARRARGRQGPVHALAAVRAALAVDLDRRHPRRRPSPWPRRLRRAEPPVRRARHRAGR